MKILIVDDEPLAREGLQLQLKKLGHHQLVGLCRNGDEAIKAIQNKKPDLVLLDIEMPGCDGFEVLERIGTDAMPLVIFLTAYNDYAVKAFSVNALDYLLKPVSELRLLSSLERAKSALEQNQGGIQHAQLRRLLTQLQKGDLPGAEPERLMIRSSGHITFIKINDILWIEAQGDYVTLHTENKQHLIRDTMKSLEEKLSSKGFVRIHRSSMVKLDCIVELVSSDFGDYQLVLNDNTTLKLSRSYREELCRRLQAIE